MSSPSQWLLRTGYPTNQARSHHEYQVMVSEEKPHESLYHCDQSRAFNGVKRIPPELDTEATRPVELTHSGMGPVNPPYQDNSTNGVSDTRQPNQMQSLQKAKATNGLLEGHDSKANEDPKLIERESMFPDRRQSVSQNTIEQEIVICDWQPKQGSPGTIILIEALLEAPVASLEVFGDFNGLSCPVNVFERDIESQHLSYSIQLTVPNTKQTEALTPFGLTFRSHPSNSWHEVEVGHFRFESFKSPDLETCGSFAALYEADQPLGAGDREFELGCNGPAFVPRYHVDTSEIGDHRQALPTGSFSSHRLQSYVDFPPGLNEPNMRLGVAGPVLFEPQKGDADNNLADASRCLADTSEVWSTAFNRDTEQDGKSTIRSYASAPSLRTHFQTSRHESAGTDLDYDRLPITYPPRTYLDLPYPSSKPVEVRVRGDLDAMQFDWSQTEKHNKRRLVQFWREMDGPVIEAHFKAVENGNREPGRMCVSCIYWEEKNDHFVTSVDAIALLESLVALRFTVEEKNRIRRNLEGFHPLTVSKGRSESEEFFKLIMGFPNPKPRNIEKDVKVFSWMNLTPAINKIIGKYVTSNGRDIARLTAGFTDLAKPRYLPPFGTSELGLTPALETCCISSHATDESTASSAFRGLVSGYNSMDLNQMHTQLMPQWMWKWVSGW